jgi:hypothetical protein
LAGKAILSIAEAWRKRTERQQNRRGARAGLWPDPWARNDGKTIVIARSAATKQSP